VPTALDFALNGFITVELAVYDDSEAFIFAGNRLIARRKVNDAEPGVAQRNFPIRRNPLPLSIRPAMVTASWWRAPPQPERLRAGAKTSRRFRTRSVRSFFGEIPGMR
jgi:hypothetical protein